MGKKGIGTLTSVDTAKKGIIIYYVQNFYDADLYCFLYWSKSSNRPTEVRVDTKKAGNCKKVIDTYNKYFSKNSR